MPKYIEGISRQRFSRYQHDSVPTCVRNYLNHGAQKGDRNASLHKAAAQCLNASIHQTDVHAQLLARAMRDGLSEHEANKTINSAYRGQKLDPPHGFHPGSSSGPRAAFSTFQSGVSVAPGAASAVSLPAPIPDGFKVYLETCFKTGETVAISGTRIELDGKRVPDKGGIYKRDNLLSRMSPDLVAKFNLGGEGLFIRINPATGDADKDVTSLRHGLFEADKDGDGNPIPKEQQYAAFIASRLPISAIVNSGNVSIHALVRLDAPNVDEYKRRYALAADALAGHWIDPGTANRSRFSRAPGAERKNYDDNGAYTHTSQQELLAINVGETTWDEWEKLHTKQVAPVIYIEFLRPSEFKKLIVPPETILVGNKHIVRGNLFVIGGAPGIGKSRCGIALTESGACGYDWLGLPVHCRFHTLVIQNENDDDRVKQDLSKLDTDALDKYVFISRIPPYGFCFDNQEFRDQISRHLDTYGMPGVVLVDPWNAVARDDKQKDYLEAIESIRSLFPCDYTGPAIGIFAHTRKPSAKERISGRGLLHTLSGSLVLGSLPRTVWVLQSASDRTDCHEVIATCCKNSNGELGPRSAWNNTDGDWDAIPAFDWGTWENQQAAGAAPKPCGVSLEVMNLIFEGGKKILSRKEVATALKTIANFGRTAAYQALEINGKFAGHLFMTTGKKMMWKP